MWRGRLISKGTHVVTWQPVGFIHLWKWMTTDMPWHLPCLREVGFGQKCSASGVQFIPVCRNLGCVHRRGFCSNMISDGSFIYSSQFIIGCSFHLLYTNVCILMLTTFTT